MPKVMQLKWSLQCFFWVTFKYLTCYISFKLSDKKKVNLMAILSKNHYFILNSEIKPNSHFIPKFKPFLFGTDGDGSGAWSKTVIADDYVLIRLGLAED